MPPRDAATVALLRDGSCGIEVYLLRRVVGMAFAGGMTVFPGGTVDPDDAVTAAGPSIGWVGPSPAHWAARLSTDEITAAALLGAAVRETFEEAGVLLAGRSVRSVVDASGPAWLAARDAVERHELSLAALVHREGLVLRTDLLRAWARWVTPEHEPRRYDARFFVAVLPDGLRTDTSTGEAEDAAWLRPADALAETRAGARALLPPTSVTLTELSQYGSVNEVLAAADRRPLTPVRPVIEDGAVVLPDGTRLPLPGPSV
jgi:8-oxo-dGTP pyrophosphatase MutT (NUDIX family)